MSNRGRAYIVRKKLQLEIVVPLKNIPVFLKEFTEQFGQKRQHAGKEATEMRIRYTNGSSEISLFFAIDASDEEVFRAFFKEFCALREIPFAPLCV